MPLDILAISVYLLIFFVQTIRHQQFQWLWFAIIVWLFGGWLSARFLPSVLGITHLSNFYIAHFYVFLGSIFFLMNDVRRLSAQSFGRWQSVQAGGWLTVFALSEWAMTGAWLVLAALTWWQYPSGYTPMLPARLIELYAFNPLYWYSIQLFLMMLFALHRRLARESITVFSMAQIQAAFLLSLLLFYFYIIDIYRFIPFIMPYFSQ